MGPNHRTTFTRAGLDAVSEVLERLRAAAGAGSGSARSARRVGADTVREIAQQPDTWMESAGLISVRRDALIELLRGGEDAPRSLLLAGSGSSHYVGECAGPILQRRLRIPVSAISGGELLLAQPAVPALQPSLAVSFSRSGDSPESSAAIENLLRADPRGRHLIVTCNGAGRVARRFAEGPRLRVLRLPGKTCDHSLVMTSSFTNLLLAGLSLGSLEDVGAFGERTRRLAEAGRWILTSRAQQLREVAIQPYERAVFLGDLERAGAAREGSLKLLEMTAGRVATISEGFLGLRHGPMSVLTEDTLLVGFLSEDPTHRAYEMDLIAELDRKRLARHRVFVGAGLEKSLGAGDGATIEIPPVTEVGPGGDCILGVVVSQLIGLFRSVREGLDPDAPSPSGAISRVVEDFPIH